MYIFLLRFVETLKAQFSVIRLLCSQELHNIWKKNKQTKLKKNLKKNKTRIKEINVGSKCYRDLHDGTYRHSVFQKCNWKSVNIVRCLGIFTNLPLKELWHKINAKTRGLFPRTLSAMDYGSLKLFFYSPQLCRELVGQYINPCIQNYIPCVRVSSSGLQQAVKQSATGLLCDCRLSIFFLYSFFSLFNEFRF